MPLHGSVIRALFHAAELHDNLDHVDHLGSLVPCIDRFHRALTALDTSHLNPTRPTDERIAPVPEVVTERLEVGRNAVLIQAESDLADLAIHTGHEAQEVMVRRTRRAQALARRLWRDDVACFCGSAAGEWVELTADGLMALYCGCARADQARLVAERHLSGEGGSFWAPHPLAQGPSVDLRLVSPLLNWLTITSLF